MSALASSVLFLKHTLTNSLITPWIPLVKNMKRNLRHFCLQQNLVDGLVHNNSQWLIRKTYLFHWSHSQALFEKNGDMLVTMESDFSLNAEGNLRSFVDRINALSCIRFLIVFELVFKLLSGSLICFTLILKRNEQCHVPLKAFLLGYVLLNTLKGVTFFLKNRSFFHIRRVTEFEENNGMTLVNNFLEALLLFWYILGFHWVQECTLCREENAVLYYLTISCIFTGFLTFVTPLIAILLLLMLVTYAKPKLKTVSYNGGDEISDDNRRCAICIDDYTKGSLIKFLPCKHHFHANCIDEWFTVRDSCPLCNRHVNMLYDLVDPSNTEV